MIDDIMLESVGKDKKQDDLAIKIEGSMRLAYSKEFGEVILINGKKSNYVIRLEDIREIQAIEKGIIIGIEDNLYFKIKSKRDTGDKLSALKYLLAPLVQNYLPLYNT
jgi:hypothetical protein